MKVKSVKTARSIWLFDLQELNPTGKDVADDLFNWIKDAYDFAVAPDLRTLSATTRPGQTADNQPNPAGAVYERGHFKTPEEVFIEITKLSIFTDGLVVDTQSSTEDGDSFADDLLQNAVREFSLTYDEETIRRRTYLSELIVRSDISMDLINPRLAAFAAQISDASSDHPKPHFRLGGIQFWSEPNDPGRHVLFTLERQAGRTAAERRYFSQAAIQTSQHFKLLEELEQIVMEPQKPLKV